MITINDKKRPIKGGATFDYELKGLSTDTKPTQIDGNNIGENSLFLELDSGDFYYFTGEDWALVGNGGGGGGGDNKVGTAKVGTAKAG